MKSWIAFLFLIYVLHSCSDNTEVELSWEKSLSTAIFKQAQKEQKLVLLSLEANWCHWCHVMEDSTYENAEVRRYLKDHFVLVKADQDANPALAARYRKYGWPATIVLNSKGEDVWKNAGYMNPVDFLSELKKTVTNPTLSTTESPRTNVKRKDRKEIYQELESSLSRYLDLEKGGFKSGQKSIDGQTFEYALYHSSQALYKQWVSESVQGAYNLCDPEWGGVYQYSTHGDWNHLHFEKLLHIQARYLQIFALDYAYHFSTESKQKAMEIVRYCDQFFKQKTGLYANAQDADLEKGKKATDYFTLPDQERRALGIPKVDTNTYTFSNAEYAAALLHFYAATGDKTLLHRALNIEKNLLSRKSDKGLFGHAFGRTELFTLRDNIPMLYYFIEASKLFPNNARYVEEIKNLSQAIVHHFQLTNGSFKSFEGDNGLVPQPVLEENIRLGRLLLWVGRRFENEKFVQYTEQILAYLTAPEQRNELRVEPYVLFTMEEMEAEINKVLIKKIGENQNLHIQSFAMAPFYTRFAAFSARDVPTDYKEMFASFQLNVGFICTSQYCSSPLKSKPDVVDFYKRFVRFN